MEQKRDIQDIFYDHLDEIKKSNLPKHVKKAAEDFANCRTNAMHGHVFECPEKHFTAILRNSCNNRFCPKCQTHHKIQWIRDTNKMALNTSHYHIVLKLPDVCYPYFLKHYREFVNILFKSAKKTVDKIVKYSDFNNSTPGVIFAFHTYGEENQLHPHLHILMTAGGIQKKKLNWVSYDKNLFNLNSFSTFYTTFLRKNIMRYAKDIPELNSQLIDKIIHLKKQELFISEKYQTQDTIINYLAKTIRGTSIQNKHISDISNGNIKFSVKTEHTSQLSEQEFIRRYLSHVLPWNQKSIRYAGLYSSASRKLLAIAKTIIPVIDQSVSSTDCDISEQTEDYTTELLTPHGHCPICKKKMVMIEKVFPYKVPLAIIAKFGKDPPIEELFNSRAA